MRLHGYTAILVFLLLIVSAIFFVSCLEQEPLEENPAAVKPEEEQTDGSQNAQGAPEYKNLVDGEYISLADMEGQIVFVNFWATWCGPCKMEIPAFIELQDEYRDKGFTIVGVSTDYDQSAVKSFIEEQKINYPVIMNTRELQDEYEKAISQPIRGIPTTIIVGRTGEIASVHVGARPKAVFKQEIEKLLPAI